MCTFSPNHVTSLSIIWNVEMFAGVTTAAKHKQRLVIRIRLVIHESFYPLQNKPALKEMASAPIEEGSRVTRPSHAFILYVLRALGNEYEGSSSSSPNLGKRVFGDLRVETYGEHFIRKFTPVTLAFRFALYLGKNSTEKSVGPLSFSSGISGMESVKGLIHIYKDQ